MIKFNIILVILWCLVNLSIQYDTCINPNGNPGRCLLIYDCPALIETVQHSPLPDNERKFLLASRCGGSGTKTRVCCTNDGSYVSQQSSVDDLLPKSPKCGRGSSSDRIYGGNDTAIDEFAWMVLLEYRQSNGERILNCGGSLINNRYILTAAHCVKGAILKQYGPLSRVRLGEYNTNEEIDCVRSDCANPIVEVGVEEVIPHEGFNESSPNRYHDIALIRLNQDIVFNDFINPICLPSTVSLARSLVGSHLTVAGWGRTLKTKKSSIKQKLNIPVIDHTDCVQKFASKSAPVAIADSQLCAGGVFQQDSCDGDSGGPLMAQNDRKFWALEGVVSFGNRCGLENWPAIYTRVSSYEDWIKSKLRP